MAGAATIGILRALLTADTASYITGLKQADQATHKTEQSIGGLGQEVAKLTPQAERMVKAFSGDKLLYAAKNLVAAVSKIGGVAKLTDTELAKTNTTITAAIAKYAALGQTAPKAMVDLEKATRATEQTTSGFGATIQGVGKDILTTAAGFLTAQAILGAFRSVVHAVTEEFTTLTLHGAAVGDVTENFERLTAQSGRLGAELLGKLRQGTHATIDDFTLMKMVNQDLAAGLNLTDQQMGVLAKGAFALAQATGGDVASGLETMNDAMVTGRTRAIALLTGKINLTAAEEKFAKALGTTREHLNDEGKLEAARVAILEAVGAATGRLGEQADGLDERVAQLQTSWTNFENTLGRTIATSPTIIAGLEGIGAAVAESLGVEQEAVIGAIVDKVDDLAIALVEVAKVGVTSAGAIITGWFAVNKLLGNTAQIADGVRLALLAAQQAAALSTGDWASWKKLDDQMVGLMVNMKARGKALQEEDQQQGNVDATTKGYIKTLDVLEQKMVSARAKAHGLNADIEAALNVPGTAAPVVGRPPAPAKGDFLQPSAADLSERQRQLAKFGQIYANLNDALAGTRAKVADLTAAQIAEIKSGIAVGDSTDDIAKKMKLASVVVDMFATNLKNTEKFEQELAKTNIAVTTSIYEHFREMVEKTEAAQLDQIVSTRTTQQANVATSREIEMRRVAFAIEQAKLWGASWQQVYAMERDLSHQRLDAEIADEREAFKEHTRILRARLESKPNAVDQADLDVQEEQFRLHVQQMTEDWQLGEQEKAAALEKTHSKVLALFADIKQIGARLREGITGNLTTILFGMGHDPTGELRKAAETAQAEYEKIRMSGAHTAKELQSAFKAWHEAEDQANYTFGERMKDVWLSIKRAIQDTLDKILQYFTEHFIVGLIKGMGAARLAERLGSILSGGIGAASVVGGSGTSAAVSGVESAVFSGGATAATAASVGSFGGAAITNTAPSIGAATAPGGAGVTVGGVASVAAGPAAGAAVGYGVGYKTGNTEAGIASGAATGATVGGLVGGPVGFVVGAGVGAIAGWYGAQKNQRKANDIRDQFQIANWGGSSATQAGNRMAAWLSKLSGVPNGGPLYAELQHAKTISQVRTAEKDISAFGATFGKSIKSFSLGGFIPPGVVMPAIVHGGQFGEDIIPRKTAGGSMGAPSINLTIQNHHHISAIDGPSVDRLVRSPEYLRSMSKVFEHNKDFITTHIVRAQRGLK